MLLRAAQRYGRSKKVFLLKTIGEKRSLHGQLESCDACVDQPPVLEWRIVAHIKIRVAAVFTVQCCAFATLASNGNDELMSLAFSFRVQLKRQDLA